MKKKTKKTVHQGRAKSNVFIAQRRLDAAIDKCNTSLNKLADHKPYFASRSTLKRAHSGGSISYENLLKLGEVLDTDPNYLQEKGIEKWKKFSPEEQEFLNSDSKYGPFYFDDDGYVIPPFRSYRISKGIEETNNLLAYVVRPLLLTPLQEDAEEIDQFLNEHLDDIYFDLRIIVDKHIHAYMTEHAATDPRYALMEGLVNTDEN